MKADQIKILLDKFWSGETTLEEEQQLKAYYKANPQLNDDFAAYAQYLEHESNLNSSLSDQLILEQIGQEGQPASFFSKYRWWMLTVGMLFLGSLGYFTLVSPSLNQETTPVHYAQEVEAEEALQQTLAAFELLNIKMKKGSSLTSKNIKHLKPVNHVIPQS